MASLPKNPHFANTIPTSLTKEGLQKHLADFSLSTEGLKDKLCARLQIYYLGFRNVVVDDEDFCAEYFSQPKTVLQNQCKELGVDSSGTIPALRRRLCWEHMTEIEIDNSSDSDGHHSEVEVNAGNKNNKNSETFGQAPTPASSNKTSMPRDILHTRRSRSRSLMNRPPAASALDTNIQAPHDRDAVVPGDTDSIMSDADEITQLPTSRVDKETPARTVHYTNTTDGAPPTTKSVHVPGAKTPRYMATNLSVDEWSRLLMASSLPSSGTSSPLAIPVVTSRIIDVVEGSIAIFLEDKCKTRNEKEDFLEEMQEKLMALLGRLIWRANGKELRQKS